MLLLTEELGWTPDLSWAAIGFFWETEMDPERVPQLWEAELSSHVKSRPGLARIPQGACGRDVGSRL